MDGKDNDKMDAVLNNTETDGGKRKGKSATHKGLITRNLRLAYGQVASEPMPKRFLDLLDQIDEPEDDQS